MKNTLEIHSYRMKGEPVWFKSCGMKLRELFVVSVFSVTFLGLCLVPTKANLVGLVGADYIARASGQSTPDELPQKNISAGDFSSCDGFWQALTTITILKTVLLNKSADPRENHRISAPATTGVFSFPDNITFTPSVTGFNLDDLIVTNGTLIDLSGRCSSYRSTGSPIGFGGVRLSIPPGGTSGTEAIDVVILDAKSEVADASDNAEAKPSNFIPLVASQCIALYTTVFRCALDLETFPASTASEFLGQTTVMLFSAIAHQNSIDLLTKTLTFAEAVK